MIEKILLVINAHTDKALHFGGGYILATVFPIAPIYGLLLSVLAGLLKEVYDYYHPQEHTCDRWDMVATWSGGVVGFIAMMVK